MGHVRARALPANTDNVETRFAIKETVAQEVLESHFGDLPLLTGSDRRQRITEGCSSMRADFDKDNRLLVHSNEVNLAERATVVSRDDPIPLSRQKSLSLTFTELPAFSPFPTRLHAGKVAESAPGDQGHGTPTPVSPFR
jgi:hypothetical protein